MSLLLSGRSIERVSIIDDDATAREGWEYAVEELNLHPIQESGPVTDIDRYLAEINDRADAAIADHHLRKRNYFPINGAELVARWYQRQFPSILVTRYDIAEIDEIRSYRRRVPVLLTPDEFNPDSMLRGLEICVREFQGEYLPSRRAWRTLVRVDDVERERGLYFYVVVPGWDPSTIIRLRMADVPQAIRDKVEPDARFHAQVNLGAENQADLFFSEWELR